MSNTSRSRPSGSDTPGTPPSVSALDAHLGYWLRVVSNHVSKAFRTEVEQHGVTVAEWVVLRALFDTDDVMPSALATTLGQTRGTISKLVDRLVAKDLVSVRRDPRDGRAQRIALRAAGRRLVPALAALADRNDDTAFGHLTEHQRASLLETVRGIAGHLGLRGAALD
jgi:DNA-binding MarR family transcriptional regulator